MNLLKLAKYLSWELINKKEINFIDLIGMLENNLDLAGLEFSWFKEKYDWIITVKDYFEFLSYIYNQGRKDIILFILKRFWLSNEFINYIDIDEYLGVLTDTVSELAKEKSELLKVFTSKLSELNSSWNNKWNWNWFEELCENFLLKSSYFESWFKEFEFEDWTDKIDRLLKLKKDIWNFGKGTNYLGYVVLEAKFKKKKKGGNQDLNWATEVNQLKNYIERLNKYWVSKYAIVITSSDYKETYRTKIWDYCRERVTEKNPFYLSLLTVDEIKKFLENKWNYENMSFDEFIERSFIKWLK